MHSNLEKRLLELATAAIRYHLARQAVRTRFALLFAALAADLGLTPEQLGDRFGWTSMPGGANAITCGDAEPSSEDIERLMVIWEEGKL